MKCFNYRYNWMLLVFVLSIQPIFAANFVRSMPVTCQVNTTSNSQFNQIFQEFLAKWKIPGATLAVMQDNKMLLSCGYGWKNIELHQPMPPNALFRLGSVSKTITALGILKLIEQNKLQLDTQAFKLLSELTPLNNSPVDPAIYKITIRNLLQMSSGWYSDRPEDYDPMFGPWSDSMLKTLDYHVPPACETAARLMMNEPLQFKPGTQFSYSNLNYCLLGLIITKITQTDYESYIKQTLLSPLGIQDMKLGSTNVKNQDLKEVKYYASENNVFQDIDRTLDGLPYSDTEILQKNYADGGWIASAPDLVTILQALFDNRLLSKKTETLMLQKPSYWDTETDYPAMGWDVVKHRDEKGYIQKTGSFTGTFAIIIQANNGMSYAVLFNTKPENFSDFNTELHERLAALTFAGKK